MLDNNAISFEKLIGKSEVEIDDVRYGWKSVASALIIAYIFWNIGGIICTILSIVTAFFAIGREYSKIKNNNLMKMIRKGSYVLMKKIVCFIGLILMFFMCVACEAAQKKVALTSFVNAVGNNYGKFVCTNLENEVLNGLVQNKNYTVVERAHLDRIFQELGLQNSGVVDSSSAIEIGKLSGADYTLIGSVVSADIIPFNNILYSGYKAKVKFSLRIVDNKTGVILVSDIVEGTKSEMQSSNARVSAGNLLTGASTEAAHKVLDQMNNLNPLSGTIISISDEMVYFDLGIDDGVKLGDVYTVYKEGKMLIHPVTGEVLGVEEDTIGTIEILEVRPNYAVGKIKKTKSSF